METIAQVIIAICGIASCYLTTTSRPNYACIWGILASPAWIYSSLANEQYGILILSIIYSLMWSYGIYNYWGKR